MMGSVDHSQFSQWYDAHGPAVLLYARQWLGREAAEDAVQEAFVQLLRQEEAPGEVRAWLFRTVRNACISRLRSEKRRERREREVVEGRERWFEAHVEDDLDGEAAQRALVSLPPLQREIVVLRIWGGMTVRETAELLGVPPSTVFDQYRVALDAIRQRMGLPCGTKKS
jgi:RNA polymerase sigma factor (sigma-70 family)